MHHHPWAGPGRGRKMLLGIGPRMLSLSRGGLIDVLALKLKASSRNAWLAVPVADDTGLPPEAARELLRG